MASAIQRIIYYVRLLARCQLVTIKSTNEVNSGRNAHFIAAVTRKARTKNLKLLHITNYGRVQAT